MRSIVIAVVCVAIVGIICQAAIHGHDQAEWMAYKLKHERPLDYIDFTIYEKNPEVGGTWYENVYPGVGWCVSLLLKITP